MQLPLTPVRLKRHAAKVFGRKVGVVCGEDRFTYREFDERADRLSAALRRLGVKKGDRLRPGRWTPVMTTYFPNLTRRISITARLMRIP